MMSGGWHLDWCCVTPLAIAGLWYAIGLGRLWRAAGMGRGASWQQAGCFVAGWGAVALSILSPLHAAGLRMFTAHMVEHEILMVVAAPLLILARPLPVFIWAFPLKARQSFAAVNHSGGFQHFWQKLTAMPASTALHALALWGWHVPVLFQAALVSEPVHILQHICFLGTALLFWWAVLSREALRRPGPALLALFLTSIHTTALGALMTFSQTVWYPQALDPFPLCGLTRLEDQQMAGLVMWIPAGLVYIAAALWLVARALSGRREVKSAYQREERRGERHAALV